MMQLTSVTVIKNLTAKTENGNYQIEHHVVSGILQKVLVTAFSPEGDNSSAVSILKTARLHAAFLQKSD